MEKNYTPLNTKEFEKKYFIRNKDSNVLNTVLLLIATLTAVILAVMLFILIQKKMKGQSRAVDLYRVAKNYH